MAPIHDTDIAEERWSKAEWHNYELWEKVELRLKKRKRQLVLAVVVLFLFLMAVPPAMDRVTKWRSLNLARRVSALISALKIRANRENASLRVVFSNETGIPYRIEKVESCDASVDGTSQLVLEDGRIQPHHTVFSQSIKKLEDWGLLRPTEFRLASPGEGKNLGIDNIVTEFCYDDLTGANYFKKGLSSVGFLILPTTDFASSESNVIEEKINEETIRQDRVAMVVLEGTNAELTFE